MKELCIRIDNLGVIEEVYTDTASLIKPTNHLVFNVFEDDFKNKLKQNVDDSQTQFQFEFINDKTKYYAYILININQLYIYILDNKPNSFSIHLIHELLLSRAKEFNHQNNLCSGSSTSLFENMQKLNNELINKGRQIEKMNQKLNGLNTLLNNRLIFDPLTHLVSRYQYRDEVFGAISKFPDFKALFCFIDIDNFKYVNDTYGHRLGDDYLVEFAQRLLLLPFENSIKIRIAGDEFGLFIYGLKEIDESVITNIWNTFRSIVIKPILIDGVKTDVSVSLGIATYPSDTTDIHLLIDYADEAMYIAKKSGKDRYHLYSKNK